MPPNLGPATRRAIRQEDYPIDCNPNEVAWLHDLGWSEVHKSNYRTIAKEICYYNAFASEWRSEDGTRSSRSYPVVALRVSAGFPLPGCGWEFAYLRTERGTIAQQRFLHNKTAVLFGTSRQNRVGTDINLPHKLVWPGFAINTLFYAAILWLVLAVPFAFRRWRRIKRDLCPECAYPVGTSELCSECGKPVSRRSAKFAPAGSAMSSPPDPPGSWA